jgi:hypothetical protein
MLAAVDVGRRWDSVKDSHVDEPLEGEAVGACPSEPSGHGTPGWWVESPVVDGVVDGWVLGVVLVDGSGLAAITAAAPPTTSRPTASANVARPRRMSPSGIARVLVGGDVVVGSMGSIVSLHMGDGISTGAVLAVDVRDRD